MSALKHEGCATSSNPMRNEPESNGNCYAMEIFRILIKRILLSSLSTTYCSQPSPRTGVYVPTTTPCPCSLSALWLERSRTTWGSWRTAAMPTPCFASHLAEGYVCRFYSCPTRDVRGRDRRIDSGIQEEGRMGSDNRNGQTCGVVQQRLL